MAFTHGKNAVFKIDDSGGTLRDLSSYVNECSLSRTVDPAETTTYGKSAKTYIAGLTDGTFSIRGNYDSTATTGPDVVLSSLIGTANTATFEYGPEGGTTGKVKVSGEAFCTSYETSAPVGDVVSFSAEFQATDTLTRGTFV